MRRQMISLFTLLFVLSLLFLQGTASAESGNEGAVLSTGSCGAELSWVLELDGTLTISGTGPMDDYSFSYGKHHHGTMSCGIRFGGLWCLTA